MNVDQHEPVSSSRGTRRRGFLLGLVALFAIGGVVGLDLDTAHAASNPVVSIDGLGSFEVLSYSWGSASTGSGQSGPNSKVHDLSFVKVVDGFSPALFSAVVNGQQFSTASITVAGKNGKPVRYEMTDVLITSITVGSATPTGDLTENVSLQFASVKAAHR
jgi:type VI protein secretion system component Hcp